MPSRAAELRTVKKLLRKFCKIKLVTSEDYEFNEKITPFTLLVKAGSVINFILCSEKKPPTDHVSIFHTNNQNITE